MKANVRSWQREKGKPFYWNSFGLYFLKPPNKKKTKTRNLLCSDMNRYNKINKKKSPGRSGGLSLP